MILLTIRNFAFAHISHNNSIIEIRRKIVCSIRRQSSYNNQIYALDNMFHSLSKEMLLSRGNQISKPDLIGRKLISIILMFIELRVIQFVVSIRGLVRSLRKLSVLKQLFCFRIIMISFIFLYDSVFLCFNCFLARAGVHNTQPSVGLFVDYLCPIFLWIKQRQGPLESFYDWLVKSWIHSYAPLFSCFYRPTGKRNMEAF